MALPEANSAEISSTALADARKNHAISGIPETAITDSAPAPASRVLVEANPANLQPGEKSQQNIQRKIKNNESVLEQLEEANNAILSGESRQSEACSVTELYTESDNEWHKLLPKLGLSAMPLQLAEHCLLKEMRDDHVVLLLDNSAENLQRESLQGQVKEALVKHFNRDLQVRWELTDLGTETPEQQRRQREKRRQQLAVEAIRQDDFVKQLQQDFAATLINSSIRPKDHGKGA